MVKGSLLLSHLAWNFLGRQNIPESAIWTKGIINRCLNIERTNRLKKSNQELGLYRLSMPKPVSTPDFLFLPSRISLAQSRIKALSSFLVKGLDESVPGHFFLSRHNEILVINFVASFDKDNRFFYQYFIDIFISSLIRLK
ncbi:hypothetical protein CEXT_225581 [Caerostris extrusa]|uniref:Uncharacterized protein n=1 Tax=Caerostris extrusa TaxID=172846 RepID=A0AAV4PPG2_CAEEX|nr:hypothetical protein CEXT_225581 [Caerostris extrusa]